MLSSGLGLHLGGVRMRQLVFNYTFDLTSSGSTIWQRYNSNGDISIQLGQNAPGESTNDWLAATYGADATSINGIKFDVNDVGFSGGKKGDLGVCSYKLYLDGDWEGSDNINYWNNHFYNAGHGPGFYDTDFPQDSIITVEVLKDRPIDVNTYSKFDNWQNMATQKFLLVLNGHPATNPNDQPNTGAVFYIKDFNFQIWR